MHELITKYVSALLAAAISSSSLASGLPRPDHVVVVIEENRGYSQIMDKRHSTSYIHALTKKGALFTKSYGVAHPSQPNYLALFSGSTQGIASNNCLGSFSSDNLASSLLDAGLSFASYSESLPAMGDTSCSYGNYKRKHNPIVNWQGTRVPSDLNKRFADFPKDFSRLPTVSFVIPDQDNDMHDGSFENADQWLKKHIKPYVEWAFKHNSLLILTWDEDDYHQDNHIVTVLVGPMVKPVKSTQRIDHYSVLRTILELYDLPPLGKSSEAKSLKDIWKKR